jgi:hypothetical protein
MLKATARFGRNDSVSGSVLLWSRDKQLVVLCRCRSLKVVPGCGGINPPLQNLSKMPALPVRIEGRSGVNSLNFGR